MIKALKTRNNIVIAWLYYAIPLTPILAMISGLFMAPWMGLNILILIFALGINLHDVRTQLRPIERIVITFSVASCFWSIAPIESFATLSRLILVMAIIYVILPNKKLLQSGPDSLNFRFKLGIIMAIFVFLIEKYTDGAIYRTIRSVIQPDSKNHFGLYWLDRGAAVLSLSAWAPIYIFLKSREIWKAILFYICILTTLILSDSTSSLLAFIIAGIITLLLYISSMRLAKVFSFFVIVYFFAMPLFAKFQDPYAITSKYDMPISYAHRLFIWKYSAEKSMEKPLLGYGLGSSKLIKPLESEVVYYNDIRLSTMPMHPHNNVMQIFLELGLVGLILFASYIWNILSRITELSVKDFELSLTSYAIFINYFVIGMISFNMWQSWWMMIILFMLLLMNMVRHAK